MPGDYFFLNYGLQDGNVMQGLFRVNKTTYELEVYDGTTWNLVQVGGQSAVANPMTTVQRTAIVPAAGVLIWDTDYNRLYVGNGSTRGGLTLSAQSQVMSTSQRTAIVPAAGVLIWDTDLGALFVGDGTTAGGVSVASGESGIVAGIRLGFDGDTLNFNPIKEIVNVTGNSVTFAPDMAYKIYATTGAFNVTANPPATNYWGLEGHAEIFVGSVGYVVFDTSKIVLANQLEPDSVNNCTLRFHDGMCYVSVEDHIAGYIVVNGLTSGEGSLPYGISSASQEYIAFDASLNGTTIDLSGSTANGEKHVVGNSYNDTILTGSVDCGTSKFTVANLSLNNVSVNGGTMTLGDAYIPSGSTVAVSGGGLAVEKVTGAGETSVIDLGGTNVELNGTRISSASLSGCTLTSGSATYGGAVYAAYGVSATLRECSITGNSAGYGGGCNAGGGSYLLVDSCVVTGNSNGDIRAAGASTSILISASTVGTVNIAGGTVNIAGRNTIDVITSKGGSGSVTISSGAILDLTGNTNPAPIAPGGGITFEEGGATVLYSSGAVSGSYMMDNVTLPAGAKLTNTAVVDLARANVVISSGATAYANGCTFNNGSSTTGSVDVLGYAEFISCSFNSNTASQDKNKALRVYSSGTAILSGCSFGSGQTIRSYNDLRITGENYFDADVTATTYGKITITGGAVVHILTSLSSVQSGITVLEGGCTVNGNAIAAGTYTSIDSTGTPT